MTIREMQETIDQIHNEAYKRHETALREYGKHTKGDAAQDAARNKVVDWDRIENLLNRLGTELARKAL